MSHLYRETVVFITTIIFVLQISPLSISIAERFSPDLAVKMFIESHSIPDFVKHSIDPMLPDVFRDGVLLSYIIASEGIVLLKNNGVLPLNHHEKIAVFGVAQHWAWYYHGGGSGYVAVSPDRVVTLLEGLRNAGFIVDEELVDFYRRWVERYGYRYRVHWWNITIADEPSFSDDEVKHYAERNGAAIVVISRWSMEGGDIPSTEKGVISTWGGISIVAPGYRLTPQELNLIKLVSRYFNKTIVILNTPGPIDMSWDSPDIDAILWVGYPGEQGGNAVAAILLGLVSPSGKLPDTWAYRLEDYPSTKYFGVDESVYWEDIYVGYRYFDTFGIDVAYPFGYGLSYTRFRIDVENIGIENGYYVKIRVRVTNTGCYPGKEVVQIYVSKPDSILEKPYQELIAFAKTDLLQPGQSQYIDITFDVRSMASYSEELSAWVLEPGEYIIRVGNSSRDTHIAAILILNKMVIVEDTENRLHAPHINRLSKWALNAKPIPYQGELDEYRSAPRIYIDPSSIPTTNRTGWPEKPKPLNVSIPPDAVIKLRDVFEGRYTLEQFVAQMSSRELVDLLIGLRGVDRYGIPELRHVDGPNGVRQGPSPNPGGTAFPVATIIAATWDIELAKVYGYQIGRELLYLGISLWLAPGLNIHRNPLGGRNFEYFSEDPLLSGVIGASIVKGVQSVNGVGAVPKHFVGNEQEFNRYSSNSIVSERALREIYLKPFEIVVKTSDPWAIMTSYNKVNNVYTGNDWSLIEGVLRFEWGFSGFVMTDWYSASYNYRAFIAGNDVLMPYDADLYRAVQTQVANALNSGEMGIEYLQRCAYNLLRVVMRTRIFAESIGMKQEDVYLYTPPPDLFKIEKHYTGYREIYTASTIYTTTIEKSTTTTITPTTTQTITTVTTTMKRIDIEALFIATSVFLIGIAIGYIVARRRT
ncbi:glycoside hydrolase family 3 domain protein [Ignisphaera aggregans DSM 17230]|uniref:Glycoside hydrolase family 3 domain protein n=1 Tax=Ignisphaera aggregans (strain DSM 17230 / JCM 13409 / AQ1.S1) TaxID=583356 RepID=E0STW0_IGNAA|nr:glycoside hydrolase family 3 domain protein [Ignisphaera aggregans DSM 17230]